VISSREVLVPAGESSHSFPCTRTNTPSMRSPSSSSPTPSPYPLQYRDSWPLTRWPCFSVVSGWTTQLILGESSLAGFTPSMGFLSGTDVTRSWTRSWLLPRRRKNKYPLDLLVWFLPIKICRQLFSHFCNTQSGSQLIQDRSAVRIGVHNAF